MIASRFGYAPRAIPDAVDPPADTPAGFQNHDLEIMGEQKAGHQAGEARADNSQSRPQPSGSSFAGNQPVIDRKIVAGAS